MFDRVAMKEMAKGHIRGNIGVLFGCALVIGLISAATSAMWGLGAFLVPAFMLSNALIYLRLTAGIKPQVGDVFAGFGLFGKALWLNIITAFFVVLWTLLLYIPGIIKMLAYSMAPYVLADNPHMTAREALRESIRLTDGAKMDLFVLQLSFLGWALLGMVTFGLAYIYVIPYMQATTANAYQALKAAK